MLPLKLFSHLEGASRLVLVNDELQSSEAEEISTLDLLIYFFPG